MRPHIQFRRGVSNESGGKSFHLVARTAMTTNNFRLIVLAVGAAGLVLLANLTADDKTKSPAPPVPAEKPTEPIKPKPLSDVVKKGLEYLVKQQLPNGGWPQGGGWRTVDNGGRVEGPDVKDPADVGNTCIAALALIRAGSTPKEGPYAKEVAKAIEFICGYVSKSDDKSLFVTDVKGTQLQSKIGPYVDTFLASMVLAEVKGRMGDDQNEKILMTALTKTISKIEKNQQADGTFAGNTAWASVLSQSIAGKALSRAAQNGVAVKQEVLDRIGNQVATNFDKSKGEFRSTAGGGLGGFTSASAGAGAGRIITGTPVGGLSDAGVPLYGQGQGLTNIADVSAAMRKVREEAKRTLANKDATKEEKEKAEANLKKADEADKLRDDALKSVARQLDDKNFVRGFGSNGGEEFLSFMNIGEALLMKGGEDFKKWDKTMTESIARVQDGDGSWSGHHCITGKTFCTATALLVLMTDRAPVPCASDKK
jgi:prenyltransferase/squalene oxidase-like repeat protein